MKINEEKISFALENLLDKLDEDSIGSACGCMGPQGDEPFCPCRMRTIRIRKIRKTQIVDFMKEILS